MVCGGRGWKPKRTTCRWPFRPSRISQSLIELEPMSTPIRFLPSDIDVFFAEHAHAVLELQAEGLEDLALRIHATAEPLLDTIDRQHREVRATGELRFGQHALDAHFADVVRSHDRTRVEAGLGIVNRFCQYLDQIMG